MRRKHDLFNPLGFFPLAIMRKIDMMKLYDRSVGLIRSCKLIINEIMESY